MRAEVSEMEWCVLNGSYPTDECPKLVLPKGLREMLCHLDEIADVPYRTLDGGKERPREQ